MQNDKQQQPEYFFSGPFRFVKPYQHTYQTHCKKRWLGKQLFPVLCKQFLAYDEQYFFEAIKSGRIKINNKHIEPTYTFKDNDLLTHNTLRQQPPILNLPIKIIHEDQQILVVEKPTSMIVHTGGGYHYNTLLKILQFQYGFAGKQLFIVHRLDRMTSGILILGKNKQIASRFHQENANQTIKKMYFARVNGNFQWEEIKVDKPLLCLSHKQGIWGVYNPQKQAQLNQQKPEEKQKIQKNKNKAHKDPNLIKQSVTIFKKVWYDKESDSSLLQCYPITGRTHQIRVHLQYLGHPILNDVGYGGKFIGNAILKQMKNLRHGTAKKQQKTDKESKLKDQNGQQSSQQIRQKPRKKIKLNDGYDAQVKFPMQRWDYKNRPWQIYLHSYKYNFQGRQYRCSKPYWAQTNQKQDFKKQE